MEIMIKLISTFSIYMKKIYISILISTLCIFNMLATEPADSVMHGNLPEFVVTESAAERNLNSLQMGTFSLSDEQILNMPTMFGEPDIVKTLQTLPGVSQGVEGFTGLYVRGGENDQNLFLFEGLPLYHVSHIGGIFSSFNVAQIEKVDFYKSSFPSQYGGRISSITDISMKKPNFDKFTGRFSIGLLSGNAFISGPIWKDKTAFSASIRRSWIDLISIPAIAIMNSIDKKKGKKHMFHYAFTDFNARIDHRFNQNATIMMHGYYGHDNMKLGERSFKPINSTGTDFFEEDINKMSWGNWGVLTNFKYRLNKSQFDISAYYSSYTSKYDQETESQTNLDDASSYGYNKSHTDNSISDFGINASYLAEFSKLYTLRTGIGYIRHRYLPEGVTHNALIDGDSIFNYNGSPHISSNEANIYIDNTFQFTDWFALNAGLRGVMYHIESKTYNTLEPRASIRINVSQNHSIKLGYSRTHQFVQQISQNYINLPTDLWQPISTKFEPLHSDQYSIGVYGNLPYSMYFSVEGWYKDMNNVLEYREGISSLDPTIAWDDKLTSGKGWSYGMDISISRSEGKLTGSIGYGLMWNWRKFDQLNKGEKFPAKFDNRHKFNINVNYKLNDKIEFNAGWTFMTGNRMTLSLYNYDGLNYNYSDPIFPDAPNTNIIGSDTFEGFDYISSRNNIRLPAYHRLDLSMNIYKRMKNGKMGIWSFGLYNAYCNMNSMTIIKTQSIKWENNKMSDRYNAFKTFSMIPIIPSVSYTYIF